MLKLCLGNQFVVTHDAYGAANDSSDESDSGSVVLTGDSDAEDDMAFMESMTAASRKLKIFQAICFKQYVSSRIPGFHFPHNCSSLQNFVCKFLII